MEKIPHNEPKPGNLPFETSEEVLDTRTDEEVRASILEKRRMNKPLDQREAEIAYQDLQDSWDDKEGGFYGQTKH